MKFDQRVHNTPVPSWSRRPVMSPKEVYEKTLKAVEFQEGLLHGVQHKLNEAGIPVAFCALGAFAMNNTDNNIDLKVAVEIQEKNDSYPKATPKQRRQYMIAWLKGRIAFEEKVEKIGKGL